MNVVRPVLKEERADILDVLRGFALLGILINNIRGFSGYAYLNNKYKESFSTSFYDKLLDLLQVVFVEGKFYSIFSLLFGIGFSIILIRTAQKGLNSLKIFYRRLLVLMVFGLIHILLIWDGDILLLYALIGLCLPLFRNLTDKNLLALALILILSPILFDAIKVMIKAGPGDWLFATAQALDKKNGVPLDDSFAFYLYNEGSGWQEFRNWMEAGFFYRYEYIMSSNRPVKVLGMFLIGFYAGRKEIYRNLEANLSLFKKLRNYGFAIGIPASAAMAYFATDNKNVYSSPRGLIDTVFYALSVIPLALAYVGVICVLWIKAKGKSGLRYLAPAGRMALTNYLAQSIIGILIFYEMGLGLGVKIGPTLAYPIALLIFILQVGFSNFWFRHFNYGPVEFVWRQLTYGKRLRLKK